MLYIMTWTQLELPFDEFQDKQQKFPFCENENEEIFSTLSANWESNESSIDDMECNALNEEASY